VACLAVRGATAVARVQASLAVAALTVALVAMKAVDSAAARYPVRLT
jgi:hypothetical protein